jgi:hypothetical protein
MAGEYPYPIAVLLRLLFDSEEQQSGGAASSQNTVAIAAAEASTLGFRRRRRRLRLGDEELGTGHLNRDSYGSWACGPEAARGRDGAGADSALSPSLARARGRP